MKIARVLALVLALGLLAGGCGGGDDDGGGSSEGTTTASAELNAELWNAAKAGDVEEARRLIEEGADVNAKDAAQQTALHYAASEGPADPKLVELLLAKGGQVHALDAQGSTPLIRAARRGYPELVEPLLKANSDVDHVNQLGWTALLETVIFGDGTEPYVETVRLLLESGADPRIGDTHGVTPRTHAQLAGQTEIAALLAEAEGAG